MRIIAGKWKGHRLASVGAGDASAHLRPTTDRTRESIFNILTHRIDFDDLLVLDLFAGTGALGLEALSRGAARATFVDNGRASGKLLADNIASLGCRDQATALTCDATRLPQGTPHDLILLDPPYGKGLGEGALDSAQRQGWIAPDATVLWEDSPAPTLPAWLQVMHTKTYGKTTITLAEVARNSP